MCNMKDWHNYSVEAENDFNLNLWASGILPLCVVLPGPGDLRDIVTVLILDK